MLPVEWLDFVFPESLRQERAWIDQFGKTRRTYLFGFGAAAGTLKLQIEDVKAQSSARFREDPRRVVPYAGWRELFRHDGEKLLEGQFYKEPPPGETLREKCTRWGSYGKDQPEHAWLRRPMRLYDALKSIALLYEAQEMRGKDIMRPSQSGTVGPAGELALDIAIYNLSRFDLTYYETYLADLNVKEKLYEHCRLWHHFNGADVPTFWEMANGLSASYRTCAAMQEFAKQEKLPELGQIRPDLATRGANRGHRSQVKRVTRRGILEAYSADCAVEIFAD